MLTQYEAFHINCQCPEWTRLAELALVIVPGSVEDERVFSAMNFIKSALRNRLVNPNLTNAMRIFTSQAYAVATFPYKEALQIWKEAKQRRGVHL